MADPIDIQQRLDDWLSENPEAQKYLEKIYYVPAGTPIPDDATHTLVLQSTVSADRSLVVAAVVVPEFALFLDMLLSMIATNPLGNNGAGMQDVGGYVPGREDG